MGSPRNFIPVCFIFMSITGFFLFASSLSFGRVSYPIKKETAGLTKYIQLLTLKTVTNTEELLALYGGSASSDKILISARYLYSKKWGWLDLRHFSAAAYYSGRWYLAGGDVLRFGESKEWRQYKKNEASAYNYEDLVSNLLGVFFGTQYALSKEKTYVENLNEYLRLLGFVDDPLLVAPNADQVPENYSLKPDEIEKSYDYSPLHTNFSEKDLNALDRKIMKYRGKYLGTSVIH